MSTTKTIIISTPKFIAAEPAFEVALTPGNSLLNANIRKSSQMKRATFQCVSTMEKIACPPLCSSVLGVELASPSRKRRLDHLSLEEKIQRKKLKNRIAAQSSRDRKKARMDVLEGEVQDLKDENKILTDRCLILEEESQRLAEENKQLREQLSQTRRVGCEPTAATGPAAGAGLGAGTGSGPVDIAADGSLPPLPDLLDDIDSDDFLSQLEELADSLLKESAADLVADEGKTKDIGNCERDGNVEMVGPPSEELESCRNSVKEEVNPVTCPSTPVQVALLESPNSPSGLQRKHTSESFSSGLETVYGTYDEGTQTLTIIVTPSENDVCIEEAVQEVVTCETDATLSPICKDEPVYDMLSPSHLIVPSSPGFYDSSEYSMKTENAPSDCGYESVDSPLSEISGSGDLSNMWNECFSELFPSLA